MPIILLGGKCGSGKDVVGKYLCNNYNYKRLAFADKLKDDVSEKYNIDRKLFDIQEYKNNYKINNQTLREILIKESVIRKTIDENYIINPIIINIEKNINKNIVITDFRFPYEYNKLKEKYNDIITVLIQRDVKNKYTNNFSENSLNDFNFDYIIDNNTTLINLFINSDLIMKNFYNNPNDFII